MQLRSMSVDVLSNVATFLHIGFKFTAKNGMKNRREEKEEEEDEKPKLRAYRTKICVQCMNSMTFSFLHQLLSHSVSL